MQLLGNIKKKLQKILSSNHVNHTNSYQQMFDLEGVTGLVVRGIGTAVTLVRMHGDANQNSSFSKEHHTNGRE